MKAKAVNIIIIFIFCVAFTNGWLFGRDEQMADSDGREIDETCVEKADEGSCEFYSCFENRLPCGREWYILRHGSYYCSKIERIIDTFPENAQHFLRDSQTCLMQRLKESYREDRLSCHDLEHLAIGSISQCFQDNAFCDAIRGNFARFFQIYETDDLFSTGAGKVWREIIRLGTTCGAEAIQDLMVQTRNRADGLLESISSSVSDLFDKKKK